MANIATGYLEIIFDKTSELNKNTVDEIMSTIENNNHFTYGGDCEGIFNKEERSIDFNFTCRWSGEYCWNWIENELSDKKINKELKPEISILLLNAEIYGGSFEYDSAYRDRVYKKSGAKKLDIYRHQKLESNWLETFEILSAYHLNKGDSRNFGNDVEITLCDKSEEERYLFKVVGGVGGCLLLIDKKSDNIEFFCDIDEFTGSVSIKKILLDLERGDLEQDEEPEDWVGRGEIIDDLIGDIDKFFELN